VGALDRWAVDPLGHGHRLHVRAVLHLSSPGSPSASTFGCWRGAS
jgi:hypothetical protein